MKLCWWLGGRQFQAGSISETKPSGYGCLIRTLIWKGRFTSMGKWLFVLNDLNFMKKAKGRRAQNEAWTYAGIALTY